MGMGGALKYAHREGSGNGSGRSVGKSGGRELGYHLIYTYVSSDDVSACRGARVMTVLYKALDVPYQFGNG